jgi:CHAD domain-containing protein
MMPHTPSTLFVTHVNTLRSVLPRVLDGDASSVHDARVSTRRIRELLQLAELSSQATDELRSRFRKMGRALGRVRDADVRIGLLAELEGRAPSAAPWIVTVRHEQEADRTKLMRRLIKRLEQLAIANVLAHVIAGDSLSRRVLLRAFGSGRWRSALAQTIRERGQVSAGAIEHATGVYFPNRLHAARIALKKLRYAMEIAADVGHASVAPQLRELKKSQDILGDLHDRQALLDELPALTSDDPNGVNALIPQVRLTLEAEAHDFHRRYLARRERLLDIVRDAQAQRGSGNWGATSLVTAGALALSGSVYVLRRGLVHEYQGRLPTLRRA